MVSRSVLDIMFTRFLIKCMETPFFTAM
uniref:Uncharacterized protein n=1 Tax=Rhizophora mucronata TaxID=61149 RepID=A0A2P2NRE9_RHIMU